MPSQLNACVKSDPTAVLSGATAYLRLFALARGGAALADVALAANRKLAEGEVDPAHAGRVAVARFFAENAVVAAAGLAASVIGGAASLADADAALQVA